MIPLNCTKNATLRPVPRTTFERGKRVLNVHLVITVPSFCSGASERRVGSARTPRFNRPRPPCPHHSTPVRAAAAAASDAPITAPGIKVCRG